jgi:hypothetical protein
MRQILWVHTGDGRREYYFNYEAVKKHPFRRINWKKKESNLERFGIYQTIKQKKNWQLALTQRKNRNGWLTD